MVQKQKYSELGKLLKKIAIDANITHNEMAKKLEISAAQLSNIMAGKVIIDREFFSKIIEKFNITNVDSKKLLYTGLANSIQENKKITINVDNLNEEQIEKILQCMVTILLWPKETEKPSLRYTMEQQLFTEINKNYTYLDRILEELDSLKEK